MGQRVNVTMAARLTSRSERTLRDWLAEDPCPLSVQLGRFVVGRRGKAGRTRWLDVDELRTLHEARGGTTWHPEYLPAADQGALRAEFEALRAEVSALRSLRGKRWAFSLLPHSEFMGNEALIPVFCSTRRA